MPDYWFPHDSGHAAILIVPGLAPAEVGEYMVTLAGDPGTTLSAFLPPTPPLGVPELVRFEVGASGVDLAWRPVEGAVEYAVAIIDNDAKAIVRSETVATAEVSLPPLAAANYSVIIRAYDFAFSAADVRAWPENPRMSELQFQGPVAPPR